MRNRIAEERRIDIVRMLGPVRWNHAKTVEGLVKNDYLAGRLRNLNGHGHRGDSRNARQQTCSDGIVNSTPIQIFLALRRGPSLVGWSGILARSVGRFSSGFVGRLPGL